MASVLNEATRILDAEQAAPGTIERAELDPIIRQLAEPRLIPQLVALQRQEDQATLWGFAQLAHERGHFDLARPAWRAVASALESRGSDDRALLLALDHWAYATERSGTMEEAEQALREAVRRMPPRLSIRPNQNPARRLALLLASTGRADEAWRMLEPMVEAWFRRSTPPDPDLLTLRAEWVYVGLFLDDPQPGLDEGGKLLDEVAALEDFDPPWAAPLQESLDRVRGRATPDDVQPMEQDAR